MAVQPSLLVMTTSSFSATGGCCRSGPAKFIGGRKERRGRQVPSHFLLRAGDRLTLHLDLVHVPNSARLPERFGREDRGRTDWLADGKRPVAGPPG